MLPELHRLLSELAKGKPPEAPGSPRYLGGTWGVLGGYSREKAKQWVVLDNLLNKNTFDNRSAIWDRLSYRYFNRQGEWVSHCLIKAAACGIRSTEFLSLAYLYYALRDRITFDFVTTIIWDQWQAGLTPVSTGRFAEFLQRSQETAPELKTWRETTRSRLGQNTLSALRDFGLFAGTAIKHIQRPTVSSETAYHLLAILWAEGKRGRAMLEAEDWKLFLWNDTDTANALLRLAQLGWIKFERGGQTVILEMVRTPGVVLEGVQGE